jgi:glycosyltransferase involved in cell wall biosynthesis
VFPSLYEGFGIPILEAFACNCPVAASNVSSLPEIAQAGAIYFDPRDETSMRQTVQELLHSPDICASLRAKGKKRLVDFSWALTTTKTAAVYRRVLDGT